MLRGVAARVNIRTPSDEDLDTLPLYEITIPLFWDPKSKFHDENEITVEEGVYTSKEQRYAMVTEE